MEGCREMTDKELLELAAKAAGIVLTPVTIRNVSEQGDDKFIGFRIEHPCSDFKHGWFAPLTDDGDALRLAVKLGIHLTNSDTDAWATQLTVTAIEPLMGDPYAATRRAIVRAAAEIGKEMK
jgi:hypothetical protein